MNQKKPLKRFLIEQLSKQAGEPKPKTHGVFVYDKDFPLVNNHSIEPEDILQLKETLTGLQKDGLIKHWKITLPGMNEYQTNRTTADLDSMFHRFHIKIEYSPSKVEKYLQERYLQYKYQELLNKFEQGTLEKMKKIAEIIEEEVNLTSKINNVYYLKIEKSKFTKADIPISDVLKILKIFSEDENYWVLPLFSLCNQTKKDIIIEFSPQKLYNANFKNIKRALEDILEKAMITVGSLQFDSLNRVLRYGDVLHKFHKEKEGNYIYLLFKKLWEERKQITTPGGEISEKGRAFPPEALAVQAGIITSASQFQASKVKIQFNNVIKSIRRIFKEKGFPIELVVENGLQFIVTIKK